MSNYQEFIRIKAELLCWGFKFSELLEEIFATQNPFHDIRTGNAGIQVELTEGIVANVPIGNRYNEYSPYSLHKIREKFCILKDGTRLIECQPIPTPSWYHRLTSDGIPMGAIILQEGIHTLITAIHNRCVLWHSNEQCRFCAINVSPEKRKSPRQIAEAVTCAFTENPRSTLDLTSGNISTPDRGASIYLDVLQAVKTSVSIPICVELSPPDGNEYIDRLFEAGADAFMINLEIGDEKLRRLFCPGKSRIPKNRYIEVWRHALELVGRGRVSTVLIAGLESKESTLRTARELIDMGIIPTIMPFRPNNGCYLENFATPNPDDVEYISKRVGQLLSECGLDSRLHPGCISCTACATEVDYLVI